MVGGGGGVEAEGLQEPKSHTESALRVVTRTTGPDTAHSTLQGAEDTQTKGQLQFPTHTPSHHLVHLDNTHSLMREGGTRNDGLQGGEGTAGEGQTLCCP